MSTDDFSFHTAECPNRESGWIPASDPPDEVESIDDLECECFDEFDSLDALLNT
jgi:hypothetical protein